MFVNGSLRIFHDIIYFLRLPYFIFIVRSLILWNVNEEVVTVIYVVFSFSLLVRFSDYYRVYLKFSNPEITFMHF